MRHSMRNKWLVFSRTAGEAREFVDGQARGNLNGHNISPLSDQYQIISARLTILFERAVAKGRSVCPSVCHTRDPRVNGSR